MYKPDIYNPDPTLLTEVQSILVKRFGPPINITSVLRLSDPKRRNLVLRIKLESSSDVLPKSIILKQSHSTSDSSDEEVLARFARDWAGLEYLSRGENTAGLSPLFYGASLAHRFVLQEDIGEKHNSLVEPLNSDNKTMAIVALRRYMLSMAQFHAAGHTSVEEYSKIINSIVPNSKTWTTDFPSLVSKTKMMLEKIGITLSPDLQNEMLKIFESMQKPGDFTTLIHLDICPDNLFYNSKTGAMKFIDFEWSFVGNALLDAVFVRMSMPTGWCVKTFPEDIVAEVEGVYRKELMKNIPAVADDNLYNEAYISACGYWTILQIAYIMEEVLDKERDVQKGDYTSPHPNWKREDNAKRPQCLYRLQTFLDISSKHDKFPQLRMVTKQVLEALKLRWPATQSLKPYHAFSDTIKDSEQDQDIRTDLSSAVAAVGLFKTLPMQHQLRIIANLKDQTPVDPYGPGAIVPYENTEIKRYK